MLSLLILIHHGMELIRAGIESFSDSFYPPFFFLFFFLQDLKLWVLEQVQEQLSDILDKALIENNPPFIQKQLTKNGTAAAPSSRSGGAE